jgi:hypothetical protein
VQELLQRQQQEAGGSSSDEEEGAAGGRQQQQRRKQPAAAAAAANGSAAGAAGAMQLLSGEADLNRQLLQAAFAGDDVEAEFAAEKTAEVEAELPSAEVAGQLPGWGTWSNQQREPAWMVAAKAKAAAQRASAAAARKDANLKHVVISEKWDKKASKYLTPSLPFPFNDKQVGARVVAGAVQSLFPVRLPVSSRGSNDAALPFCNTTDICLGACPSRPAPVATPPTRRCMRTPCGSRWAGSTTLMPPSAT